MSATGRPRPENHVIVLFGATGDLSRRQAAAGALQPPLRGSHARGLPSDRRLPPRERALRRRVSPACARRRGGSRDARPVGPEWDDFVSRLSFAAAAADEADDLVHAVEQVEQEMGGEPRRIYHLAIPPSAFAGTVAMLGETGLAERARVIVEKPFGTDLASAEELNASLHAVFGEADVFRIDHFLGKESIENILALRFANGLFEPIWNRDHVDHVQIDVPETLTVAGRSGFYEQTGAFRDMVVTHLFQVLGFIAMEPPHCPHREGRAQRDRKGVRLDEASRSVERREGPVRGVSGRGGRRPRVGDGDVRRARGRDRQLALGGRAVLPAYREVAGRELPGDHARVPRAAAEDVHACDRRGCDVTSERARHRVPGSGSISANFLAKKPGPDIELREVAMRFDYDSAFEQRELEGYERLVHDAMLGDQTLFTRGDGIERLWNVSDALLESTDLEIYEPGRGARSRSTS